jgi:hypothetical protein
MKKKSRTIEIEVVGLGFCACSMIKEMLRDAELSKREVIQTIGDEAFTLTLERGDKLNEKEQ